MFVLCMIAKEGNTSSGSDSDYEPEDENMGSKKASGTKATSSKNILNRPTGRPPQLRINERTDKHDAN